MSARIILLVSALTALLAIVAVMVYPYVPWGRLGVIFYYCTSSHEDRKEFKATKTGIEELQLSKDSQVNILIHGYSESSFRTWVLNLTDALLEAQPGSMVILVDYWDMFTLSRPYMMDNVRKIADTTANLIDLLVQEREIQREKIHLLGFSLGGRICGLVGDRVKSKPLGRITGIDASYPWLPPKTNEEYLDASDAALVVNLRTSVVGSHSPPGHIDFMANGGLDQPSCGRWYLPDTFTQVCNHYLAVWYMVEAVKHGGSVFPACRCDSWESFADHSCDCDVVNHLIFLTNTSAHGNFYFSTNAAAPYSRSLEERAGVD